MTAGGIAADSGAVFQICYNIMKFKMSLLMDKIQLASDIEI